MPATDVQSMLRGKRLRVTSGRIALLNALRKAAKPVTLEDAVALCAGEGGDPATVYRNLQSFTETGLVRPVRGVGRREMYELVAQQHGHQHAHLTCTGCGRVSCIEFDAPSAPKAEGWQVEEVTVTVWGLCPDCR
jgi:Fur family ferric uptake transcriptional regulator